MPQQAMPKPKSVGPISVLGLCSPLTLLAQAEASFKTQKARLRAQQRGRVAKGKKGRLRAALRHLWGKTRASQAYSQGIEVCRPALRPYSPSTANPGSRVRRGEP